MTRRTLHRLRHRDGGPPLKTALGNDTARAGSAWPRLARGGSAFALMMLAPGQAAELDFATDIQPILKANCIACHNKTTTKADLNMETPELMKKGGESGPALIPGKGADSIVVQAAAHTWDSIMPPKGNKVGAVNLTQDEVALLKQWIDQGAKGSVKHERQIAWQPLPPGLNPIYAVAVSKDGRYAACSRANHIFVYDLATRQLVTQLADDALKGIAHRDLAQSLAFSPDGQRLASGSYREVKIWRQQKAEPVVRKADPAPGAVATVLSADGGRIVCADKNGALRVLDAASARVLKSIPAALAGGKLLTVSPDGSKAAGHDSDATLSVWNLQSGERMAAKPGVNGLRALAWTRDGKALATAGEDKIIRVWTLPTADGGQLTMPRELKDSGSGPITLLAPGAGPDHLLSSGEDGVVRLWSIAAGKAVKQFNIAGVASLALSIDGRTLAAGCADGAVRLWDTDTGKQLLELRGDAEAAAKIAALEFKIAAETLETNFQNSEIARLEADTKALDERIKKANDTIAAAKKALPDKQKAVKPAQDAKAVAQKAAEEAAALLARAPGGKPDATLEKKNKEAQDKLTAASRTEVEALAAVKASEDQIRDAEAEIKIIDDAKAKNATAVAAARTALETSRQFHARATADLAAAKQALASDRTRALSLAFSADGQFVGAACSDGVLRVWATASGLPTERMQGAGPMTAASVAWDPAGAFVAAAPDGGTARLATATRWVLERTLGGAPADNPLADRVNALRFSPDGGTLAAGSGEPSRTGDIILWDVASGKVQQSWTERHSDTVLALDFSPDGRLVASGGADKAVRLTDIASGRQTRVFEGHTHHVMGVAFRADGRILASAGADNVVKIWDMITGDRKKNVDGWEKEVTSLQFLGASNHIVTSAGDNRVRIVRDDGSEVRSLTGLPDFMHGSAANRSATTIVAGGQDGALRVWNAADGRQLAVFAAN